MPKKNKIWRWTKSNAAKKIFSLSRWLHIYISTALFSLLILFSFTGITLNHPQWLSTTKQADTRTLTLPQPIISDWADNRNVELDALLLAVREQTGLKNAKTIEQDLEIGEITLDYPLPAGYAFISIYLDENVAELEYEKGNVWSVLNDLHKGRHSGSTWSWLIDISAVLMIFFGLTGLVILFQQARYRKTGLWLVVGGSLLPALIYILAVPALN